jgi:hypothetical protein
MTMTFQGTPVTFMARVMSVLMRPMMKTLVKTCAKDPDDIKASIERDRDAPAVSASA